MYCSLEGMFPGKKCELEMKGIFSFFQTHNELPSLRVDFILSKTQCIVSVISDFLYDIIPPLPPPSASHSVLCSTPSKKLTFLQKTPTCAKYPLFPAKSPSASTGRKNSPRSLAHNLAIANPPTTPSRLTPASSTVRGAKKPSRPPRPGRATHSYETTPTLPNFPRSPNQRRTQRSTTRGSFG